MLSPLPPAYTQGSLAIGLSSLIPVSVTNTFIFSSQAVSNSYWAYNVEFCDALDAEVKSKGGDIWIGSCRSESGPLPSSSSKGVFASLWVLEDRDCVDIRSQLILCIPSS